MFDGAGGAAAQMYVTSKKSLGKGKAEIASQTETGETKVKFSSWTGSPVGFTDGYGVYKLKDGASKEVHLLEMAGSKHDINELDDGLKDGNVYYVGVACLDKEHCDFSKAMPATAVTLPHEYYEFLEE